MLQVKCHKYYPTGEEDDEQLLFEDVGLRVTFLEAQDASYFTVRTLQLEDLRVSRYQDFRATTFIRISE